MRPDDVVATANGDEASMSVLLDAGLAALDGELGSAGAQARRMLNGQTQPTRYFSLELRRRLLETLDSEGSNVRASTAGMGAADTISRR